MRKFTINICRIYEVVKVDQVELEFNNLAEAENFIKTDAYHDLREEMDFIDQEWEHRDDEITITSQDT